MADSKEEARLKMKADANFQRNLRYKDHRLRTIGINLDGLNQQVAEKKRMQEEEREQERQESKPSIRTFFYLLTHPSQRSETMRSNQCWNLSHKKKRDCEQCKQQI
jgi:hypothetical protein